MRTLAIGDIHGCKMALETLLDSLELCEDDRLIFLGDYVDRGPDSRGVLEKLIELGANPRHVFLRGNHDDWMLRARGEYRWFNSWVGEGIGGRESLESYGATSINLAALSLIPAAHWDFLARTQLYFETTSAIFVHAAITSYNADLSDSHSMMWRSFWDNAPHLSGKRIVCGHTAQTSGVPGNQGFAVCIDTFCGGPGGWLSALDVGSNEVFQANQNGETRRFYLGEAANP